MSDITVCSNDYATLVYHSDQKIVHHTFHRVISGEEFRKILNMGCEIFREHGASKWLSDDRNNSALSPEDTEWSINDWFPRVKQAGWKYWALVVPPDVLAQLNLKEFVDLYWEKGLRIMVFTEPEAAMEWLIKVDA
jgi:hypothetical protein